MVALRDALPREHPMARVPDVVSLAAAAPSVDALVVDPAAVGDAGWLRLRVLLATTRIPVLLYARLSIESARRVVAAAATGAHEVMLRGRDDDAASLRMHLARLRHPAPPAHVMARIADRIMQLPPALEASVVPLFCGAEVPRWAELFARTAGMPRRSVDRWMHRARLASSGSLLDVARLARAWMPMVRGANPTVLAREGGFGALRIFVAHARRIVGTPPYGFGTTLTEDEFVDRLARHMIRA